MCHAASLQHPCGHAATQWTYCRDSGLTGIGTAPPDCDDRTWGNSVRSSERCILAYCAFRAGTTWTCCVCGGRQNAGGWCLHDRPRWETNTYNGWPNWVDKCEHNCCSNCITDMEQEADFDGPLDTAKPAKSKKKSSNKGSEKAKMTGEPKVVSVETDHQEMAAGKGSKRKNKDKTEGPKTTSPNKKKK